MIDWHSSSTEILFNPRLPSAEKEHYARVLKTFALSNHVWVATSGSTGRFKWAALSKEAILASAAAVNHHLQAKKGDVWLHALPDFHVGGIGIWARAFLLGAQVIDFKMLYPKWDAQTFLHLASREKASLTALVPAQIYDLAVDSYPAPSSLRATVVGGGALTQTLYNTAEQLGWHLLPSYGLTECASQVATALPGDFDRYQILPHVTVQVDEEGTVKLKSLSLLTTYALFDEKGEATLVDPKEKGWFRTEDKGECLSEGGLKIFGREKDFVKIGGESVNLLFLQRLIDEIAWDHKVKGGFVIVALPDDRLGHVIHLAAEKRGPEKGNLESASRNAEMIDAFNSRVLPYERIRGVHVVERLALTPLGKINREVLKNTILYRT